MVIKHVDHGDRAVGSAEGIRPEDLAVVVEAVINDGSDQHGCVLTRIDPLHFSDESATSPLTTTR